MFNNICVRSGLWRTPSTWGFSGQFLRTTWRHCSINNINRVTYRFQFVQCITHVRRMRIFLRNSVFAPYNCLFRSHVVGVCVGAYVRARRRRHSARAARHTHNTHRPARSARLLPAMLDCLTFLGRHLRERDAARLRMLWFTPCMPCEGPQPAGTRRGDVRILFQRS